jgi:hypothetical protein
LGLLNAMAGVGDALPPGTASLHGGLAIVPDVAKSTAPAGGKGVTVAPKKPAAKPHQISPEEQARINAAEQRAFVVEHHHLNIVKRWLLTTLRVVTAAQQHADRLAVMGPLIVNDNPDRLAFLLVAKTFKLHERDPAGAVAGVRRVESIFRRSLVAVTQHLPRLPGVAPSPLVDTPLFISLFGFPRHSPTALAYAPQGGFHLKPGNSGFFNPFVKPGKVVPELTDRMYLTPSFDTLNPNLQRLTLIHEMAHFTGAPRGANGIPELGNIDDPAKWKPMNSFQRLHTADGFGYLATECNVGTLTAIADGKSNTQTIPLFPKVEASFVNNEPRISLPPTGDVLEPKFKFPAGALF